MESIGNFFTNLFQMFLVYFWDFFWLFSLIVKTKSCFDLTIGPKSKKTNP